MAVILNKYEYAVMKCASDQSGEFSVSDMCSMLWDMESIKLGEASVRNFLDQLVKKKMLKKRYAGAGFFKWKPFYQTCCSGEYFFSHVRNMDSSAEAEKAWEMEIKRMQKKIHKMNHSLPIIAEQVYTPEEKRALREMIHELYK